MPKLKNGQRDRLIKKDRFKKCENCGASASNRNMECHHSTSYAGKRITDDWAIRALCMPCHRGNGLGSIDREAAIKTELFAITEGLMLAIEAKYPRRDWRKDKRTLESQLKDLINGYE